jgi:hypothetical protein
LGHAPAAGVACGKNGEKKEKDKEGAAWSKVGFKACTFSMTELDIERRSGTMNNEVVLVVVLLVQSFELDISARFVRRKIMCTRKMSLVRDCRETIK